MWTTLVKHNYKEIMNTHDRLLDFIKMKIKLAGIELNEELNDNTSLIKSGLFDSLALLELSILIEKEIGSQIDLTSIDIREDWDSITNILNFIETYNQ